MLRQSADVAPPLPAAWGLPVQLRVAILEFMGGSSTVLTSVKKGDLWRVQIAWPSGTTKYFGKFGSEQEVTEWISKHRWLSERAIKDTKINRPWGSVSGRKVVVDVATGQAEACEPAPEQRGKN
jgi:hypothetical protein